MLARWADVDDGTSTWPKLQVLIEFAPFGILYETTYEAVTTLRVVGVPELLGIGSSPNRVSLRSSSFLEWLEIRHGFREHFCGTTHMATLRSRPRPPARPPVSWTSSCPPTPSHSTTLRILNAPPVFIVQGNERGDRNGYTEYVCGNRAAGKGVELCTPAGRYDSSGVRDDSSDW